MDAESVFEGDRTSVSVPQVVTWQQPSPGLEPLRRFWRGNVRIDAVPGFFRGCAAQMLVRPHGVVPEAKLGKQVIQCGATFDFDPVELRLEGAGEPFDAAVLPGATGGAELLADAREPESDSKRRASEH